MRTLICSLLLAGLLAGCATTTTGTHSDQARGATDAEQGEAPQIRRVTGSRIPQRVTADGKVLTNSSSPVIVYDREYLKRTGQRDVARALGLIHPRFD